MRHEERKVVPSSLVSVVDDDESVRESLPDLLREFGFTARSFSSAEEFLASDYPGLTNCLILDVGMPGMSGLELQRELKRRGQNIPIVFITANRDLGVRSRLLEQGVAAWLFKPFSDTALLEALNRAVSLFADPGKWQGLQRAGMQQDFSWDRSAREYVKIYQQALQGRKAQR